MNLTPILLGYLPKRRTPRPDWLAAPSVEEICSVSDCVAPRPDGSLDLWQHNEFTVYNTVELARSIVPSAEKAESRIYAYSVVPVTFVNGIRQTLAVQNPGPAPLTPTWEVLGFDVVSGVLPGYFEHSPLSCNHWAAETAHVNAFCLLPELDQALELAAECERGGAEPGPYQIIEVRREAAAYLAIE